MKPIHKFNNGNGAMLCNICRTIIHTGKASKQVICTKCLEELVYNWPTESKVGFNPIEEYAIKEKIGLENINMDKYNDAMMGNTRTSMLIYHCDILTALNCGLEDRDMYLYEWD